MVTPMAMQDALNEFLLNEVASKYNLKSKGSEMMKNPQIIKFGWILSKSNSKENEEFPYIITRIDKMEHIKGGRESVVTMLFLYGVYDPGVYDENGKLVDDGSGYRDVWNLIETTRQALFAHSIIDKKFRVIDDFFEAEMLATQAYPYWEGLCRAKFHVVFPVPQLDEIFYKKGD